MNSSKHMSILFSPSFIIPSDKRVKEPKVTAYQAPKTQTNKKTTLLCRASDMFPDLVRFSWKMERDDGRLVEVPEAEREELEQKEDGRVTSVIIIKNQGPKTKKYSCTVKHEVNVDDIPKIYKKGLSSFHLCTNVEVSKVNREKIVSPKNMYPLQLNVYFFIFKRLSICTAICHRIIWFVSFPDLLQSMCSVNLASLVYTVMIVKSLVYCCGLSLLLLLRDDKGSPPHTWRKAH